MSMLAEKKRREKWSLNPRGKAWSEDQNKFGQRLMEKMGWKAGQGLGVNSQGPTDIVKARVKNDSKGLGFKENGEEWLKTTSDFDNLLDELASSQEDGDGSQSKTAASLEDRSKKSRARVHYHKFTRGKDLSRYSEKDLASIIGPDVIKLKNGQESQSDYTQNQVNKGSIEEYFKKKSKLKHNESVNSEISGKISNGLESVNNFNSEVGCLRENSENCIVDIDLAISSKKKKKKSKMSVDENVAQINNSLDHENSHTEDSQLNPGAQVEGKKNKKRESVCDEISCQELEGTDTNFSSGTFETSEKMRNDTKSITEESKLELLKESADARQLHGKISKKRKIHPDCPYNVENPTYLDDTIPLNKNNTGEITQKKNKRKKIDEDTDQLENNITCTENNPVAETVIEEDIPQKKKKKNEKNENKEYQEDFVALHSGESTRTPIASEELLTKKKKKKSKENNFDPENNPSEFRAESSILVSEETVINDSLVSKKKKSNDMELQSECGFINPADSEEAVVEVGLASKKKKKKKEYENGDNHEEPFGGKQTEVKNKAKQGMKNETLDGESICTYEKTPQCEQAVPLNNPDSFLEVLGRRTRLRKINKICKSATDISYETEDFMSFHKTVNFNKEASKEQDTIQLSDTNTDNESVNIYKEANHRDCRIPRVIINYENKLVQEKLSKLKLIKKPCIVIKNSENLSKTAVKKLEDIYRVRYYKEFLSEQDKTEINAAVRKFKKNHKNVEDFKPKDIIWNSVRSTSLDNETIKQKKTAEKKVGLTSSTPIIASGTHIDKSNLATNTKFVKNVKEEKENLYKCFAEANSDDGNIPKHVIAYEYRLVTARLKHLEIPVPEVRVVIKEASTINETTRRKLKQMMKIKQLKTLLPPDDLKEVEASVTKFHDNLKPKIEMMEVISALDEKILEVAGDLDRKLESKLNEEEAHIIQSSLSDKIEAMTGLFQKVETLLESYRNTKDELITPESTKENYDGTDEEDQNETRYSWLKKVENKLDILKKHMKMLAKGIKPPNLQIVKESQTKSDKKKQRWRENSTKFNSGGEKKYQNMSYSRGRIAHNVMSQRGSMRGIGRIQSVGKNAVPAGGWGVLKSFGSGRDQGLARGDESGRGSYGDSRMFMRRGRDSTYTESFTKCGSSFSRGFSGRGRGNLRGRGRGDVRGRGRISQTNIDAKMYAEKCKELNKVPDVLFNGVNMKVISGYAANVSVDNTFASQEKTNSQVKQTIPESVSRKKSETSKPVSGGFSEVVVEKDR